jgi:hypothetical protein
MAKPRQARGLAWGLHVCSTYVLFEGNETFSTASVFPEKPYDDRSLDRGGAKAAVRCIERWEEGVRRPVSRVLSQAEAWG